MSKRSSSAKPICHACNRPFDPRSPGATLTMGPTCAKRAAFTAGEETSWQTSFGLDLGSFNKPEPAYKGKPHRSTPRRIPTDLFESYEMAKMAFDELFREFCKTGILLSAQKAELFESKLSQRRTETISLHDLTLDWLDPEHDVGLIIDHDYQTAFHRRSIGGVVTILETDPSQSESARKNVDLIKKFAKAMRVFRKNEESVQLSLIEL